MAQENNDFFRLAIANPDLTPEIFMEAGYNVTNLQLLDKDKYKQIDTVRDFYTDDQGNFKEDEFNQDYAQVYNQYVAMASYQNVQDFKKYTTYDEDNIFAPVEQKRSSTPVITRISNPKHLGNSQQIFGQVGDAVKSDDEIAQKSKVLMNPIEATNPDGTINQDIAVWDEAPDEGILSGQFWRNMAKTFVMAQYEEDGEHINPITGVTEKHVKGQLKLNELGDPYYEYLDGRNIYGKRVLNKMNVLTPEDSWIQQYDFFDSDGVGPKSYTGTIFKNLALVGSMYLPGVGPYIAMLSMIAQVSRLGAIGAKMLGQEGFLSNSIEGFVTSWDRQHLRSEYDAAQAWSFNNWFSGCADLAAQIAEQRAIFTTIPALITGQKVATTKDQLTILDIFKKKAVARKQAEFSALKQKVINKTTETEVLEARKALDAAVASGDQAAIKAAEKLVSEKTAAFNYARESMIFDPVQIGIREGQHEAEAFFETYNKWGEMLSKAYMAGLISSNLYNEARTAGIDENTASWLTIGRFAAEMGLLMTPIGNYFLPELHMNALEWRALANKSIQPLAEALAQGSKNATTGAAKQAWHRFIWDKAKAIPAQGAAILNRGKFSEQLLSAGTMGLEAGVVNDIEALFDDLAKAAYTVLSDNENEHFKAFENNFDRYGMGLVTGLIGGSISAGFSQYKALNANSQLTTEQAIEKIAYMERNGKLNDFLDFVDKKSTHLASDHLTAFPYLTSDGTYSNIADPKAKDIQHMSQNAYLKSAIHQIARDVKTILQTSGANISDGQFLTAQIAGDLRLQYFLSSGAANRYLQEFNSEVVDLIKKGLDILPATQATDSNRAKAERDAKAAENSEVPNVQADNIKAYNEQLAKVQDLMKGKKAVELARDSMFELTPMLYTLFNPELLTQETYIQWKAGPNASEAEKAQYSKEFNDIILNKDRTHAMSLLFYDMFVKDMSDSLSKQAEEWKSKDAKTEAWYSLQNFHKRYFSLLNQLKEEMSPGQWLQYVQQGQDTSWIRPDEITESNYSVPAQALLQGLDNASKIVPQFVELSSKSYLSVEDKQTLKEILDQIQTISEEAFKYMDFFEMSESERAKLTDIYLDKETDINDAYQKELNDKYKALVIQLYEQLDGVVNGQETLDQIGIDLNEIDRILTTQKQEIDKKPNSNITDLLGTIQIVKGDPKSSILELFNQLTKSYKDALSGGKIGSFSDINFIPKIQKALFYLHGIYGAVMTARTQDATLTDPYGGYNQILNTLANNYNNQSDINEKIEWSDLVTMDAGYADLVSNDVQNIIDRLENYLHIIQQNSMQLLNQQHAVQLKYLQAYKEKAEMFAQTLTEDTTISNDDVSGKIKAILANIKALNVEDLQEDDLENIYQRTISLKQYIYEIGQALNILNASESNLSLLKGVFSYKIFGGGFMAPSASTLDNTTKSMDNRIALYEIVADMVAPIELRYKQVIDAYREVNKLRKNKPLAIIPAQLDLAVLSYSQLLNKKFFTLVQQAFRENIKDTWKNASIEEKRAMLRDTYPTVDGEKEDNTDVENILMDSSPEHCLLWLNVPEFEAMCTGIAGAGKSEAYLAIINYLASKTIPKNNAPLRVAYVSTSKEAAKKTKQKINNAENGDDSDCFSHEEFITLIAKKDQDLTSYRYDEDSGVLQTTAELKDTDELSNKYHYDLVLVDEVGFYNKARMQLITKYGKETKAHIHVVGDLEQTHARESYAWNDTHIKNLPQAITSILSKSTIPIQFQLTLQDANFVQGWKLGIAMRPNNQQQANGVQALRQSSKKFEVHYADVAADADLPKDKKGLFGINQWQFNYNPDNKSFDYSTEDLKKTISTTIQALVATLNEGEKIGLIYTSENSELYKKFKDDPHFECYQSDLTTDSHEKIAQGQEHRYCIAECPTYARYNGSEIEEQIGNLQSARESIYTAASRSIQGTILIMPSNGTPYIEIKAVPDAQPLYCSFDNEGVISKNKEFNEVMDSLLKDVTEVPKYVDPFSGETQEESPFNKGQEFTSEGTVYVITSVTPNEISYVEKGSPENTEATTMAVKDFNDRIANGTIQIVEPPKGKAPVPQSTETPLDEVIETPPDQIDGVAAEVQDTSDNTASLRPEVPSQKLSEPSLTSANDGEKIALGDIANELRLYTFNTVNTRRAEFEGIDDINKLIAKLEAGWNAGYMDGIYGIYHIFENIITKSDTVKQALDKLEQRFLDLRAQIISDPKRYNDWAIHTTCKYNGVNHINGQGWNYHPEDSNISHTASVVTSGHFGIPSCQLVCLYNLPGSNESIIIPIGTYSAFTTVLSRLDARNPLVKRMQEIANQSGKAYYAYMDGFFKDTTSNTTESLELLKALYLMSKTQQDALIKVPNPFTDGELRCLGPQLGSNLGKYAQDKFLKTSEESLKTENTSYITKVKDNYYITYDDEDVNKGVVNPTSLCAPPQVALKKMNVTLANGNKITIPAGHVFTIVPSVTFDGRGKTSQTIIDESGFENNSTLNSGYAIVFLRASSASVADFITNFGKILQKSKHDSIGGYLTSYKILQKAFENQQFRKNLSKVNQNIYNYLDRVLNRLNDKKGKALLNEVQTPYPLAVHPQKSLQLKTILAYYLYYIKTKLPSVSIPEDDSLVDWLTYNIPISKTQTTKAYAPVDISFFNSGHALFATVKVDSPVWQGSPLANTLFAYLDYNSNVTTQTPTHSNESSASQEAQGSYSVAQLNDEYQKNHSSVIRTLNGEQWTTEEGIKFKAVEQNIDNELIYTDEEGRTWKLNTEAKSLDLQTVPSESNESVSTQENESSLTQEQQDLLNQVAVEVSMKLQEANSNNLDQAVQEFVEDTENNADLVAELKESFDIYDTNALASKLSDELKTAQSDNKTKQDNNEETELQAGCISIKLIQKRQS